MDKKLSADDKTTIFDDVGRIRNRDEIARDGNRIVQGGSGADVDDTWEFERKDALRSDSSQSSDALDTQLKNVGDLREDIRDSASHRQPTVAKPAYDRDVLKDMSDDDLMSIADSLGIPDRQELSHMALVQKIREYEMRAL